MPAKIPPRHVSIYTLGCKLNYAESSALMRQFEATGYRRTPAGASPDICVVNSCTVTAASDKKSRNLLRRLARQYPDALIVATGCYAQLRPGNVAQIEGVGLVMGNDRKGSLADFAALLVQMRGDEPYDVVIPAEISTDTFFCAYSTVERTRSFLKVQDGCDYHCSYCAIPYARGRSRNIPIAELVGQAQRIAEAGHREIVLTGINTGDFGRTTGESFLDLLRALDAIEGIDRYRISSIEPNLLTDEIIDFTAASGRFQPHFHIPLQSGSDVILKAMRRRYTTAIFADRIAAVRRRMPDAFIGIDLIAGFPGEGDAEFGQAMEFLRGIEPSFLHVFPYSVREGTPAADMKPQVSPEVKDARVNTINELSNEFHLKFAQRFTGSTLPVLMESTQKDGTMSGFTPNYLKVSVPYRRDLVGKIASVKLAAVHPDGSHTGVL